MHISRFTAICAKLHFHVLVHYLSAFADSMKCNLPGYWFTLGWIKFKCSSLRVRNEYNTDLILQRSRDLSSISVPAENLSLKLIVRDFLTWAKHSQRFSLNNWRVFGSSVDYFLFANLWCGCNGWSQGFCLSRIQTTAARLHDGQFRKFPADNLRRRLTLEMQDGGCQTGSGLSHVLLPTETKFQRLYQCFWSR